MTDLESYKLGLVTRLVAWRWWYVIAGIMVVSVLEEIIPQLFDIVLPIPGIWLVIYFLAVGVGNGLLWLLLKVPVINRSSIWLSVIAWLNVLGDLISLTILWYLLSGELLLLGPLFFWPIISAIILFNFSMAVAVSVLTGLLVVCLTLISLDGLITFPSDYRSVISQGGFNLALVVSIIWAVIYVAATTVLAYQYRLIRSLNLFSWQVRRLPSAGGSQSPPPEGADVSWWQKKLIQAQREIAAKNLEIKMMDKQLDELEQAKSKFVSVTTHQMRTPLSAIKWTLSMMLSGHLGEVTKDQKEFLQKGLDSSQRLITIVNNLMHVGDVESDPTDFNWHQVDLIKLIDQVSAEFTNQISGQQLKFQFIRPKRDLPPVEADADKLKIVLENLLDNATKYSKSGGEVTIKILDDRINTAKGGVEIVVTDSGIGIPREEQKKIFHKFFRASNAVELEPDGSGIGLYISKDLVEKHGGTLWFESIPGEGTAFHFTLPLQQVSQ